MPELRDLIHIGKPKKKCRHPDRMKEWIEWMEANPTRQARHVIAESDGGFCCLGVGCEVADWKKAGLPVYHFEKDADESGEEIVVVGPRIEDHGHRFDSGAMPPADLGTYYGITVAPVTKTYWPGVPADVSVYLWVPPYLRKNYSEVSARERADALNDRHNFNFEEIAACFRYTYGIPYGS